MSTRSGKKIHISLQEDIVKSVTDVPKSERKTRSKHTKENLDEFNLSLKPKKRNYVAYPGEEIGVDTLDSQDEGRTTRALRKNTLKERNFTSTESVDPEDCKPTVHRKSVKPTRRIRKCVENTEEAIKFEAPAQDETPAQDDAPKPKKEKKKKKEQEQNPIDVVVPKKKTKKKKGRRSTSIVVEEIEPETASNINKSNMSVDSFHSAAGSPRNTDIEAPALLSQKDTQVAEARKTRSLVKNDNTVTNDEKEPRKRKSSVKASNVEQATDKDENTPIRKQRSKSSISQAASEYVDEANKCKNTFDLNEKVPTSARKSTRNATFDKTPDNNTTFEKQSKVSSVKGKRKSVADNVDDYLKTVEENSAINTSEKDAVTESARKRKTRKSAVNTIIKITDKLSPVHGDNNDDKKKSVVNDIEPDSQVISSERKKSITGANCKFTELSSLINASPTKLFMQEAKKSIVDTTFEKDSESNSEVGANTKKKSIVNATFDLTSSPFKSAYEMSSPVTMIDDLKYKSAINTTYEKYSDTDQESIKLRSPINTTFDKETGTKINTTFEKDAQKSDTIEVKRKSSLRLSQKTDTDINGTFDIDQEKKIDTTFDKNSKSSLVSSDSSMITLDKSNESRISITSDESKNEENILNTTPVLIESSMDDSRINTTLTLKTTPIQNNTQETPITPLKREGTFTKDEPEVISSPKSKTPTKQMSLPSPGFTPFHVNKNSSKKSAINVTRSIEKRRSSLVEPPRMTKVMFCSPVNNPAVVIQNRKKVIKSNLKGSNKSFVFDESVSLESRPSVRRKRSYTQSDADDARAKRKRLADDLQQSVDRLSRPRTSSASAKLAEPTTPSKKPTTPSKSDAKISRTKLPNFAALHQRRFEKMESLDECQQRKAKRAKQLLTPNGAVDMLERISPKEKVADQEKPTEKTKETPSKPETPIKSLPTFKSLNPGYTRFGFKLNLDVNPFSISSKTSQTQTKPKENKPSGLKREATLPSLTGATSVRREVAKQTVMREKSFTDRRNAKRTENRTVIKGVRTNRRFELQMRMRNI